MPNPESYFSWRAANPDKVREYSRSWYARNAEAAKARTQRWREANPERVRAAAAARRAANPARERFQYIFRRYGLTAEQYGLMLSRQGECCAICRAEEPGGRGSWHVDHDHDTKVVRGLLCHNCNRGLGFFADDPGRLFVAIKYLEAQ